MKKTTILTALLGLLTFAGASDLVVKSKDGAMPPPQLGIAPPNISGTVVSGKSLNQSLTFYNYSPKPKTITIQLIDVNKKQRPISPGKKTLVPWTILNPKTFTIPGNGEQTVRLSIRPPQGFAKKTHYAIVDIRQHVPNQIKMDNDGKGVTVTLGARYALPIVVKVE